MSHTGFLLKSQTFKVPCAKAMPKKKSEIESPHPHPHPHPQMQSMVGGRC